MRLPLIFSMFAAVFFFASCKKDLLHWQQATRLSSGTALRLNEIVFANNTLVFACGGDRFYKAVILRSPDGGHTWQAEERPDAGKALFGITVAANGNIYTCGFDGKLLRSTDAGSNWQFRQLYRYDPFKKLVLFGNDRGVLIGGVSFDQGQRLYINGAGDILQWDSLGYELNDIAAIDGRIAFCSGYGLFQRTDDSGHTWQTLGLKGDNFNAIDAHSAEEIYTCGYQGSIFKTTDGGRSWQQLRNGNDLGKPLYHLQDILFTDATHGYAVGENGLVIHTDDGGSHWMEFDRFTTAHLRCIVRCPNGDLLVCGDEGNLWRLQPKPL